MFPFDVILFDVGGVLLTNGWDHRERAEVAAHFDLDLAAFEARHAVSYPLWERDEIPVRAYLDATVFCEPRGFSFEEFFALMLTKSQPLADGALAVLEQVAGQGKCLVGALNNEARETNEYRFDRFGLRSYFKVALSSCYLGLRKPEPAIYKRALDILGRPAQRILFIDDRPENASAAETAGMKTIVFKGQDNLRNQLGSLGVI